jgi:hypothetical protein
MSALPFPPTIHFPVRQVSSLASSFGIRERVLTRADASDVSPMKVRTIMPQKSSLEVRKRFDVEAGQPRKTIRSASWQRHQHRQGPNG